MLTLLVEADEEGIATPPERQAEHGCQRGFTDLNGLSD
jgi:hypothetical protein